MTDHGEEFMEHGNVMHRFSVHQELARVLLEAGQEIEGRAVAGVSADHVAEGEIGDSAARRLNADGYFRRTRPEGDDREPDAAAGEDRRR